MKPTIGTYPEYFQRYIDAVKDDNLLNALENGCMEAMQIFQTISEEKALYAYAEGKWTIKEVIQHIIDTERIFCYRALVFARRDATPLPSFDENSYAENSYANSRSIQELIKEFFTVRKASQLFFQSLSEDQLLLSGWMSGKSSSALALGFIIAGHCQHHLNILQERYLN